jgi:hypothetical protein
VLIFPLLLFSSASPALVINPVKEASISVDLIVTIHFPSNAQTPNSTISLVSFPSLSSTRFVSRQQFHEWSSLFTQSDDGETHSSLNDLWASSAQILSIPATSFTPWLFAPNQLRSLQDQLRHQCNAFSLRLSLHLARDAPSVVEFPPFYVGCKNCGREFQRNTSILAVRISFRFSSSSPSRGALISTFESSREVEFPQL